MPLGLIRLPTRALDKKPSTRHEKSSFKLLFRVAQVTLKKYKLLLLLWFVFQKLKVHLYY